MIDASRITRRFGALAVIRAMAALVLVVASLWSPLSPSSLWAQNPVQSVLAACPASAHVFSEREVQVVAKLVVDSTMALRPVVTRVVDTNSIAFTVDTSGVPEAGSLVRLRLADTMMWNRVEVAYRKWRFEPAIASGCKVRQRVVATVK